MAAQIKVPELGESVSEATIAKWHKQEGDAVEADDLLVELETDKVTLEVNAPSAGALKSIKKQEGATVKVGDLLGEVEEGAKGKESAGAGKSGDSGKVASSGGSDSSASAAAVTPLHSASTASVQRSGDSGRVASGGVAPAVAPAARKMIAENNLSAGSIQGTGKAGLVTKGDVMHKLQAIEQGVTDFAEGVEREERVKMSRLRQRIAERLKESQQTAAILTTFNEIDMTNVISLRKQYKEGFEKKYGIKLGFMSFFVKACVNALQEIPGVNAGIDGDEIVYKNYYDIGVAVGTEQGLVVPVVRDCDRKSFAGIEGDIIDLATKARQGKLGMKELTGGTFTITNGGVYGSLVSTPIINPPQSGILGMHKTMKRPMVMPDGSIQARDMMYIALSYDHRLIDGKEAVTFLVRVKEAIEDPQRLLLGM